MDHLLTFISYFKNENSNYGTYVNGYPVYDQTLLDFVDECYKTDLIDLDYLNNIEILDVPINNINMLLNYIAKADIKSVGTILTFHLRQERFSEGSWFVSAKDKIFLTLLIRIETLINSFDN